MGRLNRIEIHIKTLEEIDLSLPNRFHDSSILGVRIDYVQRTAEIDMEQGRMM